MPKLKAILILSFVCSGMGCASNPYRNKFPELPTFDSRYDLYIKAGNHKAIAVVAWRSMSESDPRGFSDRWSSGIASDAESSSEAINQALEKCEKLAQTRAARERTPNPFSSSAYHGCKVISIDCKNTREFKSRKRKTNGCQVPELSKFGFDTIY